MSQGFWSLVVAAIDAPDSLPRSRADQLQLDGIVGAVFFVAGAVTVLFVLLNAFKYVISQGDSGRIREAKDGLLFGLAGLMIVLLSFAIVQFIIMVV